MGWIVAIAVLVLCVVMVRRTVDRETAKNAKHLGGAVLIVLALVLMMIFVD